MKGKPKRTGRRKEIKQTIDRSPYGQLYRAVVRYVKWKGGTVVLASGVQIMQDPGDKEYNYGVVVRVTGLKPTFARDGEVLSGRSK